VLGVSVKIVFKLDRPGLKEFKYFHIVYTFYSISVINTVIPSYQCVKHGINTVLTPCLSHRPTKCKI